MKPLTEWKETDLKELLCNYSEVWDEGGHGPRAILAELLRRKQEQCAKAVEALLPSDYGYAQMSRTTEVRCSALVDAMTAIRGLQ